MSQWNPDWVMKPGETLKDHMDEDGVTVNAVAKLCDLSPETIVGILDGSVAIDAGIACRLETGTDIPAGLWLNLQRIFNEGLAAGKTVL